MKRFLTALNLLIISVIPLTAQEDIDDILKLVQENAFKIIITARVIANNEVSVWNMEVSRLTISGKTVNVKLTDENIIVIAYITPYLEEDGSITLMAQGHVYLSNSKKKGVQYVSSVKSLPIELGETVLFYPLGVPEDNNKNNENDHFIIELEIQVLPYS